MTSVLEEIYSPDFSVVDVRTPAEFEQGHIVGAVNIPLFTNEERAEVGTIYVQQSQQAAIDRGYEFVKPRLESYVQQAQALGKPLIVHCWRGGMRSSSMTQLFVDSGLDARIIPGGYKAFRAAALERLSEPWKFVLVTGKTGAGKTTFLHGLQERGEQVVDLEGIAHHRGSAFGRLGQLPQPTTEHAMNILHHTMWPFTLDRPVWIEDESRTVGRVHLPEVLFDAMQMAPTHELDVDIETRVKNLVIDYGGFTAEELRASFSVIREKLGGERYKRAMEAIDANDLASAVRCALEYYDRTYDHCQVRRLERIKKHTT